MCASERRYYASLTSTWIEALLHGAYLPLFLGSAYICTYKHPDKSLLALATTMFVLCTVEVVLDFSTALYTPEIVANTFCTGAVCLGCDGDTESRVKQINLQTLLSMIVAAVGTLNQLMADGLLIYRTFVLWQRRFWIITVPIATLTGTAVCSLLNTYAFSQLYFIRLYAPLSETLPPPKWETFMSFELTVVATENALITTTNILTTALIASRIWWMMGGLRTTLGGRATRKYRRVLTMVVESGGIYTMSIVVRLTFLYVFPDDFFTVPEAIVNQLTGITPTLLIVALGLRKSIDHTTTPFSNVINIITPVSEPLEVGSPVPLSGQ
ncbi:hypothetical protein JAAARDRAFT_209447 [Jaapia argillacea MUCL 33604]|uniref:G protein-coupled receptor n=1 Tax=Jaapia argillacea MUCL 33604 TaxID=933084 RepID=A0A067PHQ4_9AGAM|nr:hypothetical protein JAAARDRAFT_209447 [Jaapia argillacea MUCL 33604]